MMIRAFLAIPVTQKGRTYLKREIKPIADHLEDKIQWVQPKKWHVTLRFLGNVDNDMLISLSQAALECVQSVNAFQIIINKISGFPSSESKTVAAHIMLDERLHFMFKTLDEAAQAVGIAPESNAFKPHITLGKIKAGAKSFESVLLSNFLLNARELVLYESRPCKNDGNQYVILQKFPFSKG